MSSPYVLPHADSSDWHAVSSPTSAFRPLESSQPSIRPMRLKVLYTFDYENKTNCLARWPQILNIRTAQLDENTQVGVIELKTCVQAIVAASPEITAKLGQDYTVYAYDYSEYETPLVGQGMLSWVLASASKTPSAPAHQSSTIVTGRVCKNILGLFGNGIQETLEVKLRLVPVPTCLQSEYLESMRKYRDLSRVIPEGFDPQVWTDFIKANPDIMFAVEQSRSQSPASTVGHQLHGLERVQQLMTEGYSAPIAASHNSYQRRGSIATTIPSGQGTTRLGSPTPSLQSVAMAQPHSPFDDEHRRAASVTSNRADSAYLRRPSTGSVTDAGYLSGEDRAEDGPPRKRAKVTKVDHPGRSSFGKSADSLRVTASAAASMRVLQPTALRPSASCMHSLECPPRVPTPVPRRSAQVRRPLLQGTKSNLSESLTTSDSGYKSQYAEPSDISPEVGRESSVIHSPEPGSSPPVIRDSSAAPSSPILPALPRQRSLHSLQGCSDDMFDVIADVERPVGYIDAESDSQYATSLVATTSCAPSEVPIAYLDAPNPYDDEAEQEAKRKELSIRNARKALGLKRSQTWTSGEPSSNTPATLKRPTTSRSGTNPAKARGGWNKEKRKQAIQSKLKSSIQAGEMPPFCENCGAIETPTWRKAYSRLYSGDHSQVKLSSEEGGIVAVQVTETNNDGSTKLFKVFKKSRASDQEDEGYKDVLLCNPCGIWLSNRRCMRPSNLWSKDKSKQDGAKEKSRKSRAKKKPEPEPEPDSEPSSVLDARPEAVVAASESSGGPLLLDTSTTIADSIDVHAPRADLNGSDHTDPHLPQSRTNRSMSIPTFVNEDPAAVGSTIHPSALLALQRAIQSSPGQKRFLGSEQSPIEVDRQSPDPARRTLFPSPKTKGPLGISAANRNRQPLKTPNETIRLNDGLEDSADKENLPPRPCTPDDGLDDLFSGLSPPTHSRTVADMSKSPSQLFKTPLPQSSPSQRTLATGDFFSSAAKAFLHPPHTPCRISAAQRDQAGTEMTPFTMHLNQLLSENPNTSPDRLMSEMDSLPPLVIGPDNLTHPNITDGGTPSRVFRTTDFDFAAFTSSDIPMPSSPPSWFGVYEDPSEQEGWSAGTQNVERKQTDLESVVDQERSVCRESQHPNVAESGLHEMEVNQTATDAVVAL